jgi:hypothetical protein
MKKTNVSQAKSKLSSLIDEVKPSEILGFLSHRSPSGPGTGIGSQGVDAAGGFADRHLVGEQD